MEDQVESKNHSVVSFAPLSLTVGTRLAPSSKGLGSLQENFDPEVFPVNLPRFWFMRIVYFLSLQDDLPNAVSLCIARLLLLLGVSQLDEECVEPGRWNGKYSRDVRVRKLEQKKERDCDMSTVLQRDLGVASIECRCRRTIDARMRLEIPPEE